jgi:integrase
MSVRKRPNGMYETRWLEGDRHRSRSFRLKRDADRLDAEVQRMKSLGTLADLDAGMQSLDEYVTQTWAPTYAAQLPPKTRRNYSSLYDHHIAPQLGPVQLRKLSPEMISRWHTDRLSAGGGPVAVHKARTLLGNILQRAVEGGHLKINPQRNAARVKLPRREEVRPVGPAKVEAMRAASSPRDAALISVLAYSGLRPGEALALEWGDVRDRTLLVERAISLGEVTDTKNTKHRTVRLLAPLALDLAEWRMRCGRPTDDALIFPSLSGSYWTEPAYQSWRRRAFKRALTAAGIKHARPYDLRHSFASLLLHEGRMPHYVARQLGHDARLTLTTYGHVIEELDDAPRSDPEAVILAAREPAVAHGLRSMGAKSASGQ